MTNKIKIGAILILIAGAIFAYTYQNKKVEKEYNIATEQEVQIKNEVTLTSKVNNLSEKEKEELKNSVDSFMNEYKLPKGVQNSYTLSIEKRKNDAIEMVVNKGEEGDLGNIVIHARKVDGVWQVDPSGGPWCTLEQFESGDC